MIKTCKQCSKEFNASHNGRAFCSLDCANLGKKYPQPKSKPWLPCSICLGKIGLGKKRVAKIIKVVSPFNILRSWKRAGFDCTKFEKALSWRVNKKADPKLPKEKKRTLTPMELYYLNHEESKRRCRENAKKRYWRLRHDPYFTTKRMIKNVVARMVRKAGTRKHLRSQQYLGCKFKEARQHIESQFKRGMSWQNYGKEWEIDHIMPLAAFDLSNPDHLRMASRYTNLRPLWKDENRMKSDQVIPHQAILL